MATTILGVSLLIAMAQLGVPADGPSAVPPAGPIRVTVTCDKTVYAPGEPGVAETTVPAGMLKATLTAKNVSGQTQRLEFRSGQKFDFVIRSADGKEVRRWSEDMAFAEVIETMELAPGKELTYSVSLLVDQSTRRLREGDYALEGILTCHPPVSARARFKIVPRPPGER
jgi:hypothetical protein